MALVTMDALLRDARADGIGVGAFNVGNLEMVRGAVQAAEELNAPIILQVAEVRLGHSPLGYIGPMMVQAAKEAKVDIAVHFDHGQTMGAIRKALEIGFTSVMFDGSHYSFAENIEKTKEVVEYAHSKGVVVEAELGQLAGVEDDVSVDADKAHYTKPEEVVEFVSKIGASHIIRGLRASMDFEYEFQIDAMNRHLSPHIRTVYFMANPAHSFVSSSNVREIASLGGSIDGLVPECNIKMITERLRNS